MKPKFKKFFSSEIFYKVIKILADFLVGACEGIIKQWLGTVVGGRVFKWVTDMLVSKFFKEIVEPFQRVTVIKQGYYFDVNDAENRFKKLKDTDDPELYLRTLNDVVRKRV